MLKMWLAGANKYSNKNKQARKITRSPMKGHHQDVLYTGCQHPCVYGGTEFLQKAVMYVLSDVRAKNAPCA